MDAGNIPPVPTISQDNVEPQFNVTELGGDLATASANADRNKARAASLLVAGLVHAIVFVILAWMVVSSLRPEEVELVVEASTLSSNPAPEKRAFSKKIVQDKPSAPSRMATKTISAANVSSPVVMPEIEEFSDFPAFGSGDGTGFGGGGFGSGGGASFLGTSGGGNRIILVVDTSTSMPKNCGAKGIEAIRREIEKTITALAPGTRFNIICFGNDADGFASQPVPASATNKNKVKKWMADYFVNKDFTRTRTSKWGKRGRDDKGNDYTPIPPESISSLRGTSGGSRMDLALVAAFKQKPSAIFLLADGEPGTSRGNKKMSHKQIVDLIESEAKSIYRSGIKPTVNCISVKGIGEKILKDIAKRFRGKYKSVDPAKV